ncbi:hypothetical protein RHSIM_Rhsim09G0055100 [Rhododendron simsii]|uniref:DDE Tnp4 domain-containing protein n=1 Tax=Rhododendron simsii TaxID=118357 RepID=A0A834GFM6_RHOSS|nr:hypothetical protein RHSIM_Rhsim09G0055100 [Rhododendron simsii]
MVNSKIVMFFDSFNLREDMVSLRKRMNLGKKVSPTGSHRLGVLPPGPYRVGRANWDSQTTKLFLQLAIKEIETEGRGTTQLSNYSMRNIAAELSATTGELITLKQCKNRYGVLKRDWQAWILLADSRRGATGLGWNPVTGTFTAPDYFWANLIAQNECVAKFRDHLLEHEELMQRVFEKVTTTSSLQCTPGAEGELGMGADGRQALATDNDDQTETDGEGNTVGIENGDEIDSEYTSAEHGRGTPLCSQQGTNNPLFPQYGTGTTNPSSRQQGNRSSPFVTHHADTNTPHFPQHASTNTHPASQHVTTSPTPFPQHEYGLLEILGMNCVGIMCEEISPHIHGYHQQYRNEGNELPNVNYPSAHQQSNELYQNGEGFVNMSRVNSTGLGIEAQAGYDNWEWMNNNNGNAGSSGTNVYDDDADSEYSIPADEFYAEIEEDEMLVDILTVALLHAIQILRMPQRLPFRTCPLSGKAYLYKLMNARDERFQLELCMPKDTFAKIVKELQEFYGWSSSRMKKDGVDCCESFAMFMHLLRAHSNRRTQERFQHSGDTVNRHVHKILACMRRGFTVDKLKPTRRQDETHEYLDRRNFYKPFKGNCIGAIDGTHVMIRCKKKEDEKRFFSRKGYATQNIMAVCDFDLTFVFASAGWEGIYYDYSIFKRNVLNPRYRFPKPNARKYYLVDAGYPNRPSFLAPYKGYRFGFLALMPWYEMPTQVDLVLASMAIHNYIRRDRELDDFFAPISLAYEYAFEDLPDEDPDLEDRLDNRDDIVDEDNVPEMNDVRNNIRSALRRLRRRGYKAA